MATLREQAASLKEHAWLARFRSADTTKNNYNQLSDWACKHIAGYVDAFIDRVLAANPADDEEAITEDWLRSVIGFNHRNKIDLDSNFALHFRPSDCTIYLEGYDIQWPNPTMELTHIKTRGQLRRLCEALGIKN
jgi:hypothetical protein